MRRFREVLTLWFAPVVSVMLVALKVEEVNNVLTRNNVPPWLIGALLAIGVIVVHVITVISPYKKYEKLEKNKWVLLYAARFYKLSR